jgi:hypothetical protein
MNACDCFLETVNFSVKTTVFSGLWENSALKVMACEAVDAYVSNVTSQTPQSRNPHDQNISRSHRNVV